MQIEKPAPPVLSRRGGCQLYLFVLCSKVLFRQADSCQTTITNFRKFLCAACVVDGNITIKFHFWAAYVVCEGSIANTFDVAIYSNLISYTSESFFTNPNRTASQFCCTVPTITCAFP